MTVYDDGKSINFLSIGEALSLITEDSGLRITNFGSCNCLTIIKFMMWICIGVTAAAAFNVCTH